jgi:hypothetical protein
LREQSANLLGPNLKTEQGFWFMSSYIVWFVVPQDNGNTLQVPVNLTDPLWGDNTWSIKVPNKWIGTGSGTYEVARASYGYFVTATDDDVRFKLALEKYPQALNNGMGWANYRSPTSGGWVAAKWYGRDVVRPDTWQD